MAPASAYDGFIFDYGGVLVSHQTDDDQARMAAIAGIPAESFGELYWAHRLEYDTGALSGIEYWQTVARESANKLFDLALIDRLIELDSQSWMRFDSVMWDWISQLRSAGKRVAMLSNMPRDLGEALKTSTNRLSNFDHVTLSYEVGAAKPDPSIYEHCLEGLNLPPERTLFLDDRLANVHGAELLGMHAVEFLNRDDVLSRLRG